MASELVASMAPARLLGLEMSRSAWRYGVRRDLLEAVSLTRTDLMEEIMRFLSRSRKVMS